MTRIAKPEFGRRRCRPAPVPQLDDAPPSWWQRVDWLLVSVVATVFVASLVWFF